LSTCRWSSRVSRSGWRDRQAEVCAAASLLAAATNRLGLAAPVDPAPRQFHGRDIQVLDAERFTVALTAAIADPDVAALLAGLGHRAGSAIGALPGAIDQAVDSTDVLEHPDRCRAAAAILGFAGRVSP
jgi:hypothetical protein